MNNIALWRSSAIIFDITGYSIDSKQVERYGFAVYPLIKLFQTREYFSSGLEILPVYRGAVPRKLTDILARNTNVAPKELLKKMREDGEIQYAGTAHIVVKAVDSQRHAHFLKSLQEMVPSSTFLTTEESQRYTYARASN